LLVALWILAVAGIAGGIVLLVAPKRVRTVIQDFRTNLFGERWAQRQQMIYTPIVGGIGMIAVGSVLMVLLVTVGPELIQ
jgi:uncharacterized membrane protein